VRVLAQAWEAFDYLCAQLLNAPLPQWLPCLRPRMSLTNEVERQFLAFSPRQIDGDACSRASDC